MLNTKEFYSLLACFEKEYKRLRLDKEPKELWKRGNVYENGQTNLIFNAYMRGYALGKCVER